MSITKNSRPVDPAPLERFRVWVSNRQQSFTVTSDQSLLAAMEQSGTQAIDVGCRCGGCGRCRIQVLHGQYESKRMSRAHVSEHDEAQGLVLACRILARSDLVIESDQFQDPRQATVEPNNNNEECKQ